MAIETNDMRASQPFIPVADRIADAAMHAAHLSHEARLLKSKAADAIEDSVYAAKRAVKEMKRGVERVADLRDDAAHYVKRQPLKAIAIAASAGLVVGIVGGWIGCRWRMRSCDDVE